ncbi:hypothetical protein [Sulfitobacter sp. M23508]|uniref:hypothetical protein n=1 Tax=Sulfitobacter sp. M23508 TaxID=3368577 RepID=UPI003747208C
MTPAQVAARENDAARRFWGSQEAEATRPKGVAEKIIPLLGSGISRKEAARIIGCTPPAITNALRKIGGAL